MTDYFEFIMDAQVSYESEISAIGKMKFEFP